MNKSGAIIIIEDDLDDQFLLEEVFSGLNYENKRKYFSDGQKALEYFHGTPSPTFLILSDINMPNLDGFQLRQRLQADADLHLKCIPYLFFSTGISYEMVLDAYGMSAQGYFVKPCQYKELVSTIRIIMEYWGICASPNDFLG